MAECNIILDIPSLRLVKEFKSNEELDGWLYSHRGALVNTESGGITYQLSGNAEQMHTKGMIDQIQNFYSLINRSRKRESFQFLDNLGNGEESTTPVPISVTSIPKFIGPKKTYPTQTKKQELISDIYKNIGKDFDKAVDYVFMGIPYADPKVIKNSDKVANMIAVAEEWKRRLQLIHGEDCIFMTQVNLAPKECGKSFFDAIHLAMGTRQGPNGERIPGEKMGLAKNRKTGQEFQASGENINTVIGTADLVVIDNKGVAHIYDFKTSKTELSLNDHSDYVIQISSYRQFNEQWEVQVDPIAHLLPVLVVYDKEIDPKLPEDAVAEFKIIQDAISVDKSNPWSRDYVEKWFPTKKQVSYDGFEETKEVIEVGFPGGSASAQERQIQMEVDQEMQSKQIYQIKENDRSYANGNRIRYYKRGFLHDEFDRIDAKTPEELREKIAEWIVQQNENAAKMFNYLAEDLKKVLLTRNIEAFRKLAANYNQSDISYIVSAFGRYVEDGWSLVSNELMINNGYFLFQKKDIVEMVTLSTHNIFNRIHFDHGKTTREYNSIMGQFASDEDGMDSRWVLPNFYGNMEFMKSMIFLAQHPEIFKNTQINKISVVSLVSPGYMEESNQKLVDNYNLFASLYEQNTKKRLPILTIGKEVVDDVTSYVNQARDMLMHSSNKLRNVLLQPAFASTRDATTLSLQQIIQMINVVRGQKGDKMYKLENADYTDPSWKALQYLWRAFLSKISYQISPDVRTGALFNGGIALDGNNSTAPADSKSAVLRTLNEATYSWSRICQTEFVRYTAEWKKLIKQFYKETGHNMMEGAEYKLYERFFQSTNGQLDQRFVLKPRGTMGTEVENRILDMFYNMLDRFKYGNKEKLIEAAIENGTYGEIPLVRSDFNEMAGKNGISKALLATFEKDWMIYRDFLLGADISAKEYREMEDLNAPFLPSLLFRDSRERNVMLEKNGVNRYTTDLDYLFGLIVAEGIKRERSPQMLMVASAIRGLTSYMMANGAEFGNTFEDTLNKYIRLKIFNRPIIEEGEENLQAAINVIKGITSITTLGASMRAFTRESITGIERAYVRLKLRPDLQKKIKLSDYTEALTEVIEKCYENTDVMSWHMQLNAIFGTANFSYNQMAENSTVQQFGIKNFKLSDLFFTATWPDFIHRNALVIAYLKGIGAYKAYSMQDGILTYDMTKDDRFQTFLKYKQGEVPTSEIKKWEKERDIYADAFNSWKNNGYVHPDGSEFKFGDKLPQALSPRDVLGLKDIADRMYGNYDEETKSLMRSQLFGSLFLQFRTYGINRLKEFFDGDHFTSDIHMEDLMILNDKGELEPMYMIPNPNKEAVAEGTEMAYTIKPESQVDLEQIQSGEAVRARRPVSTHIAGGSVQSIIDMAMTFFVFKNQEEFDNMWKNNPYYKANVTIFLLDTFGMMLLAFLINQLYKGALQGDYDEIDWFTQWSYNVAIGVTQDGPLWTVLSGVIGNGAPPMLGILQNYSNNILSVLTGKENILYSLVNTFGATRELAYLFHAK